MTAPALVTRDLSRAFGGLKAVEGVNLSVKPGEFMVILGPAGAGKTTTLRMIAGLEAPDRGSVILDGADVTAFEPKDRNVAMIFDSLALYPNKTGFENIATPLRIRGMATDAIRTKVEALAGVLQVQHILGRLPKTMSGGERQRIALGRALIRDPSIFLLDEPLSSLDAKLRVELRAELKRLQRERGATFLCATPDFAEAMAVGDRIAVLIGGMIRQVATPQTLYNQPADRDVARFVGAPEINLVSTEYDPANGGRLRIAGIETGAAPHHKHLFNGAATRFESGLRPEQILVAPAETGPANGRIVDSEPLGVKTALTVDTGGTLLRAAVPERVAARLGIGADVHLRFDVARSLCFDPDNGRRLGAADQPGH